MPLPSAADGTRTCAGSLAARRCQAIDTVVDRSIGNGRIAISAVAAICRAVRLRHRGDQIGGRERRRQRQIGRDQQRDAAAQPEIDKDAVDRAGGIAARRDQHVVLRRVGLDRQRARPPRADGPCA